MTRPKVGGAPRHTLPKFNLLSVESPLFRIRVVEPSAHSLAPRPLVAHYSGH